jgi:hypothetical protein
MSRAMPLFPLYAFMVGTDSYASYLMMLLVAQTVQYIVELYGD